MKRPSSQHIVAVNESLLGGAAISLSDLAIIESQEIQWLFIRQEEDPYKLGSINKE